jgi:hypothetical protein
MKLAPKLALLMATIALHFPAFADARLDGMKKMNSEGCVQAIQFEERAPKDASQVKPYCTCVYEVYFDGFTPSEQSQLYSFSVAPKPEKLTKSLPLRLKAAKEQCRKKIGF